MVPDVRSPDELTELFRTSGRKVTAQRQCIFRILQGDETHPSAEAVHAAAVPGDADHLARTVYQTLNDLADLGEIAALDVGTGRTRFDPNVDDPHHHLVCRSCGSVRDLVLDFPELVRARRRRPRLRPRRPRGHLPRPVPDVPDRTAPSRGPVAAAHRPDPTHHQHPTTERNTMPDLKDSKTEENLKEAFAGESQANRRYLYFAQKADVEGYPDVAALFRSVAEGETGHAFGHFDFLREVGDPVTGAAVGPTEDNLKSAIEGETYEYSEMYPGFAKTARDEGFDEIAEWFETLARAEKSHAGRFTEGLASVA